MTKVKSTPTEPKMDNLRTAMEKLVIIEATIEQGEKATRYIVRSHKKNAKRQSS